jgi:hypothetical protein
MKSYCIYFKNAHGHRYEGCCKVGYNESGFLIKVEILMEMTTAQRDWFFGNLPITLKSLLEDFKTVKMQVVELQEKISFVSFWDTYAYKIGKKDRAEKLWKQLNDEERTACMLAIPKYKKYIYGRTIEMVYPETFLNQRRWENEF